jgi:hypothetical protein
METGTGILLGVGVGVGVWWLLTRSSSPPAPPTRAPAPKPGEMYRGSDLGFFAPVLSLPFVNQAYRVLAPINDKVIQPFVRSLNESAPVTAINTALGGKPTTTVNPDGTITRTGGRDWYSQNVGNPISGVGTGIVHAIGGLF